MSFLNNSVLTIEELQIISEIDSSHFGFIDWTDVENFSLRELIRRAIGILQNLGAVIENRLVSASCSPLENMAGTNKKTSSDIEYLSNVFDANTYCKLGHLHLVLEEYDKALSAYQHYFKFKHNHRHNLEFLYGIGIVYFHFKAFRCIEITG